MPTDTATAAKNSTFRQIPAGASFDFEKGGRATKVVYDDGRMFYRGSYGQMHEIDGDHDFLVFNVQTEEEREAAYAATQEAEGKRRAEAAKQFRILAACIAECLGEGFARVPDAKDSQDKFNRHVKISTPHNFYLSLHADTYGNKGKVVACAWAAGLGMRSTEIKFSEDKTPAQMANDISRRLLPGAIEVYAKEAAAKVESDAYNARKAAAWKRMAKAIGAHSPTGGNANCENAYGSGMSISVSGSVNSDVRMEFSVPIELAEKIAAMVRKDYKK